MRFWFTLGLIVLVGVFAFRSCSNKFGAVHPKKPDTKKPAESPFRPDQGKPVTTPPPASAPAVVGADSPGVVPKVSRLYRFAHREPPLAAELQIAAGNGCTVAVDRFSRSVVASGVEADVLALLSYFEQIDTVGGSCAVQAWAVYVDKSAQKGFDFVAALAAVTDGDSKLTIGNGGIVWDINSDSVNAALAVIADGSVVEVIQRPHVHLEQGAVSRIESLQEVPIPNTSVSQGIAQTSVEYRKVGLQLEVTPYFLASDRLRLGIVQSNGLLGRDVKIGENEVPIIETQTVSSSVEMSVGQTVILGGVSTLRNKTSKGIFKDVVEVSQGSLYVIVSTSSSVPKALPVVDPLSDIDSDSVPLSPGFDDPRSWIRGQLLPRKGWQAEEKALILEKTGK